MGMICQSCGMSYDKDKLCGTEADGSLSRNYCRYCYKNGEFTNNFTMEEMIKHNLKYLNEFNKYSDKKFSKDEAQAEMMKFFPTLERWKK